MTEAIQYMTLERKAARDIRMKSRRSLLAPGKPPSDDMIFAQLFDQVSAVEGTDWGGNPIPLLNATRNWVLVKDSADVQMPFLCQLDPLPERDTRTGIGRSKRLLRALLDIRMVRQPDQNAYPDNMPFATILNNWKTNLYNLISPSDNSNLGGLVIDCYPIDARFDYGIDSDGVAVVQVVVEILTGG